MIDPSEHWKGDFVMDPAMVYNGGIHSLDHAPNDISPPNQDTDTAMQESPVTSDTSSSSQVTLVVDDSSLSQTKAPDHLGGCFHEYADNNNSNELLQSSIPGFVDPTI